MNQYIIPGLGPDVNLNTKDKKSCESRCHKKKRGKAVIGGGGGCARPDSGQFGPSQPRRSHLNWKQLNGWRAKVT